MTGLEHIDRPIRIGHLEIRNRVFLAAHSTNFAERYNSERLADYYAERAKGGVGLVIQEPAIVHPSSLSRPTKVWGFDPETVAFFRWTTEAVHREGASIFCQLLHNGGHMGRYFSGFPLWGPSEYVDPHSGDTSHEMSLDEIGEVVHGFAQAAEHCRRGGFDGVEIHGSHGYLVQQFLSPLTNHRTDAYGGDVDRRRRFLFEIIEAVRGRVGDDFVVGVRMAGDERLEGGITTDDAGALAGSLEALGTVDYVNVSTGAAASGGWIVLDGSFPRKANAAVSKAIKAATGLPVLMAGRVAEPAEAEQILQAGEADMVGVVRALIADPAWLAKARAGVEGTIRPCTYCNECIAGIGAFRPIRCSVNPDMGHERDVATAGYDGPARHRRRVVVVGGGVAGMECAVTAAGRGHDVVLLEAAGALGGQLLLGPDVGLHPELVRIAYHLEAEVTRLGVSVELGVAADAEIVVRFGPDAVVVATGSVPGPVPNGVLSAADVLTGLVTPGEHVVVSDGGVHAWEFDMVLEHLARRGHHVTAVTHQATIAAKGTDAGLLGRLVRAGVEIEGLSRLVTQEGGGASITHLVTGRSKDVAAYDSVVVASGRLARSDLVGQLGGKVDDVAGIGDSLAPRDVRDAIHEGRAAARRIGSDG
jgi:2,4-dienoyl-CoA reductase (NADPH2)